MGQQTENGDKAVAIGTEEPNARNLWSGSGYFCFVFRSYSVQFLEEFYILKLSFYLPLPCECRVSSFNRSRPSHLFLPAIVYILFILISLITFVANTAMINNQTLVSFNFLNDRNKTKQAVMLRYHTELIHLFTHSFYCFQMNVTAAMPLHIMQPN